MNYLIRNDSDPAKLHVCKDACKLCQLRQIVACYSDACSMLTSVWLTVNLHQSNDWQWQIEKRSSYIVWVVTCPENYQIVSHFLVILIVHNLIFSTFLIHDLSENICRWLALSLFLSGLSARTLMIRQQQCRPLALSYPSVQPDTVVAYATIEIINEIKHLLK